MTPLLWILASSVILAVISLAGGLALLISRSKFKDIISHLVSLSAGALLGGALVHLIPESIDELGNNLTTSLLVVGGLVFFYILEQFIHWHHCHREVEDHVHPVSYLLLVADSVHNFIDGLAVASSFVISPDLGLATLIAVSTHELPQELGDFGVMIHSGWSVRKALWINLLSSLTFLVGALVAYFVSTSINISYLLPIAAGGFIYIAAVDLLPQVNKECEQKTKLSYFTWFVMGIGLLVLLKIIFGG